VLLLLIVIVIVVVVVVVVVIIIISCNSRVMDFLSLASLYKLDRKCKERNYICSFISCYFVSKIFIPQDLYV